jgi:hypothetical protein
MVAVIGARFKDVEAADMWLRAKARRRAEDSMVNSCAMGNVRSLDAAGWRRKAGWLAEGEGNRPSKRE